MKQSDIKVGRTYRNRGNGTTTRVVIAIGDEHRPEVFLSDRIAPNEPGVMFMADGCGPYRLYLSMFAQWAGSEVIDDEDAENSGEGDIGRSG